MITKKIYGNPFNTEAVITNIEASTEPLKFFTLEDNSFKLSLTESDIVYGLGEQVRGVNKRGWQYISWNYDNPNHQEDTRSLYGSHNFIVVEGQNTFGAFFDYGGKVTWDIDYTTRGVMTVTPETMDLVVYIVTGADVKDIVKQFRAIIGKSYVAPLWAFGYGQSRWGYMNEADVKAVLESYKNAGIPLDSIYLDIDYMERYKDFTVDGERFPDLAGLADSMKAQGVHLVPIIDAGVKIEKGYDVYEEGVANNYFCKNAEGGDFVGAVWPGRVHFPDFLNPEARHWFGMRYGALTSLGIDGFWNDMNEPAIFYTEDRLNQTLERIDTLAKGNLGIDEYFEFTGMVAGLNGHEGDYSKFYHNVDGEMVNHAQVHNLYGMNMTRSAYEALCKLEPEKRTLFFSRSSYIGAHRYGGIWQGDNKSWWSHILMSMSQLVGLNMAGFLFTGPDVGGFGCDTTEDLMLRWLQYSVFTPLFRNHSCDGTRFQELYRFSTVENMGKFINIRYCLIPYLYSEYLKAVEGDSMMFRPLGFDFVDDGEARSVDDQLLLGDELMIAPVYKQNATGRSVYLPDEMMLIRMRAWDDYECEIMPKGHHYVSVKLHEMVFFVRKGKAIPWGKPADNTASLDMKNVSLLGYKDANYSMYGDDGISLCRDNSSYINNINE